MKPSSCVRYDTEKATLLSQRGFPARNRTRRSLLHAAHVVFLHAGHVVALHHALLHLLFLHHLILGIHRAVGLHRILTWLASTLGGSCRDTAHERHATCCNNHLTHF